MINILDSYSILKAFILQASESGLETEDQLHKLKKVFAKQYAISLPTNFQLQAAYEKMKAEGWEGDDALQRLMRKRKVRTLSGVSVITVLTKPYDCPGQCVYCPSEPGMPKSYLSNEPGAMRAVLDDFDPYDQVATRLDSLQKQGHEVEKIEMIVLGGTFTAYEEEYRERFIQSLYEACNGERAGSLLEAQEKNEKAKHKIIGLSLETRPDHVTPEEIQRMRAFGATKVQIGVQHIDDEISAYNKRGETVADVIRAMKLLRDAGFKIATHLMPNLPGSTPEKDVAMVKEFFENPDFKPDQIKLYPCVVTPYSELELWWKAGKYESYPEAVILDILTEMQLILPEWVRLERLFRDIPGESILEGSQMTNMRQILEKKMKDLGQNPRDIRWREIKGESYKVEDLDFVLRPYDAADGKEIFISFEDKKRDKLCSLLRLRFPSAFYTGEKGYIPELEGAALIREVHTYGAQVKTGVRQDGAAQHVGLGRRMLEKAEELALAEGFSKMAIIAGVGVRDYYKKWGYELEGSYMTKSLK